MGNPCPSIYQQSNSHFRLIRYIIANTTVVADETDNQLKVYFSLSSTFKKGIECKEC